MEAPRRKMRILVDRVIYQGLRYISNPGTPLMTGAYQRPSQDQDEKGSVPQTGGLELGKPGRRTITNAIDAHVESEQGHADDIPEPFADMSGILDRAIFRTLR